MFQYFSSLLSEIYLSDFTSTFLTVKFTVKQPFGYITENTKKPSSRMATEFCLVAEVRNHWYVQPSYTTQ